MKKIVNLIFIFIIAIIFMPNVYALNNVEIESVSLVEKSDDVLELSKPNIKDLDIGFDLSFVNVGNYAKYKVVIKNNSSKDYYFNQENKFNNSDYISYTYEFLEKTDKIKANSSMVMYITLKYSNKVPEDKLNNYIYTEDNNMSINLSDIILTNPSTYTNYLIVFIILLLVLGYIVYDIKTKKKIGVNIVLLILLLIPIGIHALENITIRVSTKVLIEESRNMIESRYVDGNTSIERDFWEFSEYIKTVTFETKIVEPEEYEFVFDVSDKKNNSIMAYLVSRSDNSNYFDLYIMSNGYIYANYDSSYFFDDFINLYKINKIENYNTSYAENMANMFSYVSSLEELDLSSFDTSNVTDMSFMFEQNYYFYTPLKYLNLSSFDTSKVTDMNNMFFSCNSLTSLNLSNFNTKNVTNMQKMFMYCDSLTNLNLSNFDTSKVTDMSEMFCGCSSLTNLDLSSFDTSKVTNMSVMFSLCVSLISLDLSSFDTSNVTVMRSMFRDCNSLTNLNLSSFDTSNVTDMTNIFYSCNSLTNLDLSSFDTSKLIDMSEMFFGCSSLISLDLSSFDTSNVIDMRAMFRDCNSLTNLNLSSFDTSNVTNMGGMFMGDTKLITLDLSSFDTSKVNAMYCMFSDCSNIENIYVGNSWDVSIVNSSYRMFENCTKLPNFNSSVVDKTNANTSSTGYLTLKS